MQHEPRRDGEQGSLFGATAPERVDLGDEGCGVVFTPAVVDQADRLFEAVRATTPWEQHHVRMFGEQHLVPRLESWHGDPGCTYAYSGVALTVRPWTEALTELRGIVQDLLETSFNSVLCNLYRDGADKVGWHADDEPELGPTPTIASVSLGATRRFRIRPRDGGPAVALDLPHGSLLTMSGNTQQRFVHELAPTRRSVGERINLTFRTVG